MHEIMTADEKGKLQLESKNHAEPDPPSLDDCHRSVLNIIAERSPCPEPRLFITAINSGLECFRGMPLGDLREFLGQCVQDLKASGLVEIVDDEFVIADPGSASAGEDTPGEVAEAERHADKLGGKSADQDQAEKAQQSWTEPAHHAVTDETEDTLAEDVDASPESVEDAEVLDLTDALELIPDVLDEISIDQDQAEPSSDTPQPHSEATDDV